ncbi:MAG: hypothetical protein M0R48_09685 [Candidatus Omnitrophica bacterium]|nr:hypothetical protein [Candidatus Omnitrophota bacterium]
MKTDKQIGQELTHRSPANKLGVLCYHTNKNRTIDNGKLTNFFEKILQPVHDSIVADYERELAGCRS